MKYIFALYVCSFVQVLPYFSSQLVKLQLYFNSTKYIQYKNIGNESIKFHKESHKTNLVLQMLIYSSIASLNKLIQDNARTLNYFEMEEVLYYCTILRSTTRGILTLLYKHILPLILLIQLTAGAHCEASMVAY